MLNINIITAYKGNILIHQLDVKRYLGRINFCENSHADVLWDYVVVFQNLNHDFDGIRYRKGGLIFIAGEPQSMEPYCNEFFRQFDYVIIPHPDKTGSNLYHANPALNWHFGRSFATATFKYAFKDLLALRANKTKDISMMCSNKTMMPGHVRRFEFYNKLRKEFDGAIDFFGSGINPIDDKADILIPYRFHICIENSNDEHYWTEKIADPILGYSIPIYCGAPNILDYFPKNSMVLIDIEKPDEAIHTISKILQNPQGEYAKRLPALLDARNLLLDKYNMFPMLENFIAEHHCEPGQTMNFSVKSYTEMKSWRIRMTYARIRRLLFKLTH